MPALPKIQPETIVACDLARCNKDLQVRRSPSNFSYGIWHTKRYQSKQNCRAGNKYVTAAKKYVFGEVGIDFLAGPSEVMIIADETANPEFVSADMLAQCEHDIDARAFLICTSNNFAKQVEISAQKQLEIFQQEKLHQKLLKNLYQSL